jgi:hypothetical protein
VALRLLAGQQCPGRKAVATSCLQDSNGHAYLALQVLLPANCHAGELPTHYTSSTIQTTPSPAWLQHCQCWHPCACCQ